VILLERLRNGDFNYLEVRQLPGEVTLIRLLKRGERRVIIGRVRNLYRTGEELLEQEVTEE